MPLHMVDEWTDRDDDRACALPGGRWATANDRALVAWGPDGPGTPDVRDEPVPGPLVWSAGTDSVHWGPIVVGRPGAPLAQLVQSALADVGSDADRRYELAAGAVRDDGERAVLVLRRRKTKVAGASDDLASPEVRIAIVSTDDGQLLETVPDDDAVPTAVSWARGPLLLARAGSVLDGQDGDGALVDRPLGTPASVPRCLAVSPLGMAAAGMGDGSIVAWELDTDPAAGQAVHDGPVRSLAWAPDRVIVASSGDLGVTIGMIHPNRPEAGQPTNFPFFTIWRRPSASAPWRYVAE